MSAEHLPMRVSNIEFPKSWVQEMDFWLEDKSLRTRDLYRRHIRKLYHFLSENGLPLEFENIRLGHLKKFGSYISEHEVASNRRPVIAAVKSLWKYLASEETISKNVANGLKLPKVPAPVGVERILTPDEVKEVFDTVERHVDRILLTLLYYGGMRISEAVKVQVKDLTFVELPDDEVMCRIDVIGKGSKYRLVELNKKASALLKRYVTKYCSDGGYLFPGKLPNQPICADTGARRVKKITAEAGLPHVTCHFFRHGIASHLLQAGADIGSVSKFLGHSSISTTSRYIHKKDGCISDCIK